MKSLLFSILLISAIFAQTLFDGFNRANNTTIGNNWTENETGVAGAEINNNMVQLNTNSVNGREWVYQDVSGQYETTFDNNSQLMSWCFNIRQSFLTPSGFNDGKYGILFVLGATSSDYTTASGYGLALGKEGGTFPLRLLRFSGGMGAETNFVDVVSDGNYRTNYVSVKVTYNPTTNTWTLYAKDSPTTFFNPTTVTTQIGSPTVDATHTGSNLAYIGMFYNHGASGTDYGLFDDIYIPGTAVPSTFVQFTSASGSAGENAGTYTMNISITNPHSTIATTADVALIGGTATNGSDISTYTTQGITFSSGGSANQTVNITITNDSDFEGTENLVFELQNVSGGQNAQAGVPGTHNLNIIDDDVPRLMISEVADPSDNANVRYVELYNNHNIAIDFSSQAWYLCRQNNGLPSQRFDIQLTGSVAAHEIFVVAVSQADFFSTFGYNPDQSDGSCDGDGRDGYFLYFNGDHSSGTLVDSYGVIDVDGESQLWDYIDGHAERNAGVTGPNPVWTYTEWTVEQPITTSELSPDDTPLPVQLKSFSAIFRNDVINITWVTSSEVNTLGYIILRAEEKDGNYEEISSYISNPALMGAGFSNVEKTYHFTDHLVTENKTYWYKLIDVSADGSMGTHGPIVAVNDNLNIPVSFSLEQNYPNPFNPSTNIAFNIPLLQENFINIDISVFDILGRRITTLIKGHVAPGRYLLSWDGKDQSGTIVAAGIYIYKFTSNLYHKSRKMIFLK